TAVCARGASPAERQSSPLPHAGRAGRTRGSRAARGSVTATAPARTYGDAAPGADHALATAVRRAAGDADAPSGRADAGAARAGGIRRGLRHFVLQDRDQSHAATRAGGRQTVQA